MCSDHLPVLSYHAESLHWSHPQIPYPRNILISRICRCATKEILTEIFPGRVGGWGKLLHYMWKFLLNHLISHPIAKPKAGLYNSALSKKPRAARTDPIQHNFLPQHLDACWADLLLRWILICAFPLSVFYQSSPRNSPKLVHDLVSIIHTHQKVCVLLWSRTMINLVAAAFSGGMCSPKITAVMNATEK